MIGQEETKGAEEEVIYSDFVLKNQDQFRSLLTDVVQYEEHNLYDTLAIKAFDKEK